MKLFAPEYYKDFKCIADKCKSSCCVGWLIGVDEQTYNKYLAEEKTLPSGLLRSVRYSADDGYFFKRDKCGRCVHLREDGLCRLIALAGDKYLPEICREHPRFYHMADGRLELGIGMACEAAAELILSSDEYDKLYEVEDTEDFSCHVSDCSDAEAPGDIDEKFSALAEREKIYAVLKRAGGSYRHAEREILAYLGASDISLFDDEISDAIENLEYLREEDKELFLGYFKASEAAREGESYLVRTLAYFIYRYASGATSVFSFRSAVWLSLALTSIMEYCLNKQINIDKSTAINIARIISEEIEYSENNMADIRMIFEFM